MSVAVLPLSGARPLASRLGAMLATAAALTLAACNSSGFGLPDFGGAPTPPVQSQPLGGPAPVGETLGTGPVRVGFIAPLTQGGAPSAVGVSLRNAAQLALEESGGTDLTLMIQDDRSTPEGAAQAAQAAFAGGAQMIVGPLFASGVREVGTAARQAGKPVIAFSTDVSVASKGVYLLSFLIEGYVDRIVEFAASRGKKSFAVLAPQSDYGNIAVGQFQQTAARVNARVVVIARYAPGQPASAVKEIAAVASQVDAVFVPEQADGMAAVASSLQTAGVKAQLLGTGVWNDARVIKLPQLQGAWFAAPENAGFNAFAQRYHAKFNADPTRLATLSYDAVSLVAALARTQGAQGLSEKSLTNPSGFNGADGVFRFRPDGTSERGLAVLTIGPGGATVLSPAPRSFAGG